VGRRVLDQEARATKQENAQRDRLEQLERMVQSQTDKLESLESLVNTLISANSSSQLNIKSSANGIAHQSPPSLATYHSEDDLQYTKNPGS
jgi:uncharacterized membrane protein YgaE (UPF0421/DUF939 family)